MKNLVIGLLAALTCTCFYLIKSDKIKFKTIVWAVYALLLAVAFYLFFDKVVYRFTHPEVWDFTCFYLYGKVAAGGHNFYLPENFHAVFNSGALPLLDYKEFTGYVVDVGFPYPPPSILYFVPLGYLSYNNALICWTIFNLFFVMACIWLVYSMFLKADRLNGILLVTILFFIFSPARATVFFSQTNFILLYLLLMMQKYAHAGFAGIFLAIAIFTKPYMIIFLAFFVLIKNWKAVIYFILSSVALVAFTAAIFGTAPFKSYIFDNPSKRLPEGVYFEDINQSLHSVLLRAKIISIDKPLFFLGIMGVILLAALLYLLYLQKRKLYDYTWAVLLLTGLILYPGTLNHYQVLLLFIVFQFFDNKQLGFKASLAIPIAAVFYFLSINLAFVAICFLLIVIILKQKYLSESGSRINFALPG